jgi:hypothetical protein
MMDLRLGVMLTAMPIEMLSGGFTVAVRTTSLFPPAINWQFIATVYTDYPAKCEPS